ncbi:hypothetical protein QUF72_15380 [Desulfobacterales bacterium HSG2]|nr:hypothetical protein [Desulfobacterales bacterium HSG2]
MTYVRSILYEEYQRLRALSDKYRAEIGYLPRGSVSIKTRRQRKYLYLAYRQKNRVRFRYIGSADSENAKETVRKVGLRKQYEEKLRKVRKDLTEIERIMDKETRK